jgi:CDP-diacylglycerol--serine O-phosphatidyltransferase
MRAYVNPANVLTSMALAAGFLAILLAADGKPALATAAIVAAAMLDSLDGLVARRLRCSGRFGSNLDSLADLVAFAVAPAFLLQRGAPAALELLASAAGLVFVLAAAWRLARFPLVEDREHFVGLPVPVAGLVIAMGALLALPTWAGIALALALALLMVGSIRFPTLARLARGPSSAPTSTRFTRTPPASRNGARRGGRAEHEDEGVPTPGLAGK